MSSMSSTLATSFLPIKSPPLASPGHLPACANSRSPASLRVGARTVPKAASSSSSLSSSDDLCRGSCINRVAQGLKTIAKAAILIGVAASVAAKPFPARAEAAAPVAVSDQALEEDEKEGDALTGFLESNPEAVESLKSLLQEKLQQGEDEEALKLLDRLVAAQPSVNDWRFLTARLLSEMGRTGDACQVFEEILVRDPLSFEALFENALLMDRCGEGEAAIGRLKEALDVAVEEDRAKEARDVRLIMAQVQFLQKDVEGAMDSYQELTNEDPSDFRPYFCRGMIYSLLDRNEEAREQFAMYHELSPKKFEVDGYLRTPLSRMKVFGTGEDLQ